MNKKSLIEKIHNCEAKYLGNRATVLGRAALITGMYNIGKFSAENNQSFDLIDAALVSTGILTFGVLNYITDSGKQTFKVYTKTKDHIEQGNTLDEKFIKKMFGRVPHVMYSKESSGYCEWQGVYLGAKAKGKSQDFKKIKEEFYTKKIPLI